MWFGTNRGASRYNGTTWQTFTSNNIGLAVNIVFTLGTLIIPLYLIISLVYTAIRKVDRDRYLLLSWKTLLVIPAFALSVLLHGVIYGLFYESYSRYGGDEALFFIIALILIPIYIIISLIYSVIRMLGRLK